MNCFISILNVICFLPDISPQLWKDARTKVSSSKIFLTIPDNSKCIAGTIGYLYDEVTDSDVLLAAQIGYQDTPT